MTQSSSDPAQPAAIPVPAPPAAEDAAASVATGAVSLAPRFFVPLGITLLGALCIPLQAGWAGFRWLALVLVLFGGFLLLQARLLRLEFAEEALVVWRGDREIRRFPYQAWLGWRLFWPAVPVLFYFREERSIHLLPVLFDATSLRQQLEQRLPRLAPPPAP
jgi:hypothetical protein